VIDENGNEISVQSVIDKSISSFAELESSVKENGVNGDRLMFAIMQMQMQQTIMLAIMNENLEKILSETQKSPDTN
jgi:hypothetical protein